MEEIGTYKYRFLVGVYPTHKYEPHELKVTILEEQASGRLRIRFEGFHADRRGPGTVTVVEARNVSRPNKPQKLSDVVAKLDKFREYDPELIRKPYKDD